MNISNKEVNKQRMNSKQEYKHIHNVYRSYVDATKKYVKLSGAYRKRKKKNQNL
jgi:hypothetical protein